MGVVIRHLIGGAIGCCIKKPGSLIADCRVIFLGLISALTLPLSGVRCRPFFPHTHKHRIQHQQYRDNDTAKRDGMLHRVNEGGGITAATNQ